MGKIKIPENAVAPLSILLKTPEETFHVIIEEYKNLPTAPKAIDTVRIIMSHLSVAFDDAAAIDNMFEELFNHYKLNFDNFDDFVSDLKAAIDENGTLQKVLNETSWAALSFGLKGLLLSNAVHYSAERTLGMTIARAEGRLLKDSNILTSLTPFNFRESASTVSKCAAVIYKMNIQFENFDSTSGMFNVSMTQAALESLKNDIESALKYTDSLKEDFADKKTELIFLT